MISSINLIIFMLATIGMTDIVTKSSLFRPIRDIVSGWGEQFEKLIYCSRCFGFHAGWFIWLLIDKFGHFKTTGCIIFSWLDLVTIFIFGCIGSYISYFGCLLVEKLRKAVGE